MNPPDKRFRIWHPGTQRYRSYATKDEARAAAQPVADDLRTPISLEQWDESFDQGPLNEGWALIDAVNPTGASTPAPAATKSHPPLAQLRAHDEDQWRAVMSTTDTSDPRQARLAHALAASLLGYPEVALEILTTRGRLHSGADWPVMTSTRVGMSVDTGADD